MSLVAQSRFASWVCRPVAGQAANLYGWRSCLAVAAALHIWEAFDALQLCEACHGAPL